MEFNPVEELKKLVSEIEGKVPTEILSFLESKVQYYKENGIHDRMHIGRTDWDLKTASEWLLSMFIGITEAGKLDHKKFNMFGNWLNHVYYFIIENKENLQ